MSSPQFLAQIGIGSRAKDPTVGSIVIPAVKEALQVRYGSRIEFTSEGEKAVLRITVDEFKPGSRWIRVFGKSHITGFGRGLLCLSYEYFVVEKGWRRSSFTRELGGDYSSFLGGATAGLVRRAVSSMADEIFARLG